jgi:prophage DNA circulation protein
MAEDQFEELLFTASYGGLEIDIISTSDDISRTLIAHEFPFRDGAVLEDTGGVPRRTDCNIVFLPTTTRPDMIERFLQFEALTKANDRTPRVFSHPLTGVYDALPENVTFDLNAEDRDFISMQVTFVEAGLDPAAFQVKADLTVGVGVAQTNSAKIDLEDAVAADTTLAEIDDSPEEIAADSLTTAQTWRDDPTISQRQINLELNELANRIDNAVDELELATNLDSYPTLRAFYRLHGALRRAASAAIATAPKLTELTARTTSPLMALLQDFYGGRQAVERFDRVIELNDIPNPAEIPTGTIFTVELP